MTTFLTADHSTEICKYVTN